mgnify:FL=1
MAEIKGKCGRVFKNQQGLAGHTNFCRICRGTMEAPGATPTPQPVATPVLTPTPEPPPASETIDLAPVMAMVDNRFEAL